MIEWASASVHVPPWAATSSRSHAIQYGSVSHSVPSMSHRTAAGATTGASVVTWCSLARTRCAGASPRGRRSPAARAHSWTSSISVPKLPFGCTNATVVPRLPGRGCWSIAVAPAATIAASAAAQSSTR